jgi:hypothetical protein
MKFFHDFTESFSPGLLLKVRKWEAIRVRCKKKRDDKLAQCSDAVEGSLLIPDMSPHLCSLCNILYNIFCLTNGKRADDRLDEL